MRGPWRLALITAATLAGSASHGQPIPQPQPLIAPLNEGGTPKQLERSWQRLNGQMDALDQMLGPAPALDFTDDLRSEPLPEALLKANSQDNTQAMGLNEALTLAFRNNPNLAMQRLAIAAQGARVASASGLYWPTLRVVAAGEGFQSNATMRSPYANDGYGLGPAFNPGGDDNTFLITTNGSTKPKDFQSNSGPFYIPAGGAFSSVSNGLVGDISLRIDYDLLDFGRTPTVRAARAHLDQLENSYANALRVLQLDVSEAYFRLQRDEQLARIYDAMVRTDLVVLDDTLGLKQAGIVPRVDLLRRSAMLARNQEKLIQTLADRAVARRRLWMLLNLPATVTPSASDPINLSPRWPLTLEDSLLAAYRDNPELEAITATRRALALQKDATAAALLPRLRLFAAAGAAASVERTFNLALSGGGCCGSTVVPLAQSTSNDWSLGLSLDWLVFDAGTTSNAVEALKQDDDAAAQHYINQRNGIRLRLEQAFFNHEASLAKLLSARRALGASKEAFRDASLRYQTGLTNEVELSITQEQLVDALVRRLIANIDVNITYAQLLRELLPMPRDPSKPVPTRLTLPTEPQKP
ncbi:TolC family protein [Synechococcus sp. RS9916]|uniref:TolC family protein n=1 Tax=Synechococcus sp. RS9916 TaxID=221359 RepID=UPI0000E534E5|nr:TolC family protein [Synechococcus sp. RS9916]EAU74087.1 hypothetical protein RS9916_31307 [Synechococcus sp. RS9916]